MGLWPSKELVDKDNEKSNECKCDKPHCCSVEKEDNAEFSKNQKNWIYVVVVLNVLISVYFGGYVYFYFEALKNVPDQLKSLKSDVGIFQKSIEVVGSSVGELKAEICEMRKDLRKSNEKDDEDEREREKEEREREEREREEREREEREREEREREEREREEREREERKRVSKCPPMDENWKYEAKRYSLKFENFSSSYDESVRSRIKKDFEEYVGVNFDDYEECVGGKQNLLIINGDDRWDRLRGQPKKTEEYKGLIKKYKKNEKIHPIEKLLIVQLYKGDDPSLGETNMDSDDVSQLVLYYVTTEIKKDENHKVFDLFDDKKIHQACINDNNSFKKKISKLL